ncbi:2-haloacid dehalogenase [Aliiroseovarius halocynthiae]|uniref:HAD family phosphatase n=1 Tax=Aliiroseovarius halocynthiae TaxID=985055 RepID=A0A545SN76_9RHOB|nr:HAD family phosphatase [Aliiroseovarius halocynthiae]TQV66414.1 HAD family phosphatase [Aliiroseovarius halocynthiae]SMR83394.1 2-haloacid dehalogenase [Aliiroseovarius halocynthiae]
MTQNTPVTAVVFDIGNVLIRWQPEELYDQWIGQPRREQMFAAVDLHGMNELVDQGQDFRDMVYDAAEKHPEFRTEILWWHDRWLQLAQPAIDLSVATLRALKARGVPVFALSNFGIQTFDIAEAEYDFLSAFDRRYISGQMGVTKPSAQIYQMLEDDCGHAPGGLLFTDDRPENIAAAEARGWQVHHFTSPRGWADALIARNLIKETDL